MQNGAVKQHPQLIQGTLPGPSLQHQTVECDSPKQLQNQAEDLDPHLNPRQHRLMDQTCETGCSKFIDCLKSANGGVQKHGAWMSEGRCDPWPLSSTSRYPETGDEPQFQLVAPQGKRRLTIMTFPCNVGSLESPNSNIHLTMSSLFNFSLAVKLTPNPRPFSDRV